MAKTDSTAAAIPPGMVRCVVVTPESTVLDTVAKQVSLPLFDGQAGVAPGHSPLIGRLGAGAVRISGESGGSSTDGGRRLFVEGGFVEVNHDVITVITQRAMPVETIDSQAARADLERVGAERAVGDEAIADKDRRLIAGRALLRAAQTARR